MRLPLGAVNKGVHRYDVFDSNGQLVVIKPSSLAAWSYIQGFYEGLDSADALPEELKPVLSLSYVDMNYPQPPKEVIEAYRKK